MIKSFDDVKSTVIGTRNKSSQFVTEGTKSFNEIEIKPIEWIKGNQLPAAGIGRGGRGAIEGYPLPKGCKKGHIPWTKHTYQSKVVCFIFLSERVKQPSLKGFISPMINWQAHLWSNPNETIYFLLVHNWVL